MSDDNMNNNDGLLPDDFDNEPSYLDMSDDEIMNMSSPPPIPPNFEPDDVHRDGDEDEGLPEVIAPGSEVPVNTDTLNTDPTDKTVFGENTNTTTVETETGAETGNETDYKNLYEQVMAPFKANGREMKVDSIEDVRTLMQMGANYNKKMAALKPHLKIVRMLENNGLLDEAKLNFLIDLDKKNPAAMAKFIKDSGVDPLDLDTSKSDEYTPNTYNVGDTELGVSEVLSEIRESSAYGRTLDVVNNKWDSASRKILLSNPQSIKIINAHIESGLYDVVWEFVERERVLGRMTDVTDLDAYKVMGEKLEKSGYFKQAQKQSAPSQAQKQPSQADRQKEQARIDRKKAAGSPTIATTSKLPPDFNPLDMSDEEFEKMSKQLFKR